MCDCVCDCACLCVIVCVCVCLCVRVISLSTNESFQNTSLENQWRHLDGEKGGYRSCVEIFLCVFCALWVLTVLTDSRF